MTARQTQAEKLADAYADAEMFLGETILEIEETLKCLRTTKKAVRVQRMTLARKMKAAQ